MGDLSLFGAGTDELARTVGGWPADAVIFAAEVIGSGDDPQILLTGGIPSGVRTDGRPTFDRKAKEYKAAVLLSAYRAAIAKATGAAQ